MKFMNMKRFGAAVMTAALALSLTAPAFAASNTSITIDGEYKEITLDVTVPTTGAVQINPYGLPVDLKVTVSGDETVAATISKEQITTGAVLTISNESKVALSVSADVVGTIPNGSGVILVEDLSKVAEADAGKKNIAARFEAFAATGIDADSTDTEKAVAFAKLNSDDAALTAPVLTTSKTTTGELILRAGDEDGDAQDGGVAFIRLAGEVTKKPTDGWTAPKPDDTPAVVGDVFTATIAFTFEPSEYVGTVELTVPASVTVGATGTVTVDMPAGVKAVYDTIKWESSRTASLTVADATTAPAEGATNVAAVSATLTGVKAGTATITVEFEGDDGIVYRGTVEAKCG